MDRYAEALEYLFSATDYERMRHIRYNADTFSLDRMRRLLELVGSPERRIRSVHVAGTKGKGSTAAMVHAIAMACGLRAGLYTSPHLIDIRERIRVGRDMVGQGDLARLIDAARPAVERLRAESDPATFFEIFTALAMMHFAEVRVDLAVMEVGMGGRLDATNVLVPEASVITAISLDHTEQLGETLALIAGEKAGIIKPGVPVVAQPQPAEALRVIECACSAAGSPLTLVGRDVTYEWSPMEAPAAGEDVAHAPAAPSPPRKRRETFATASGDAQRRAMGGRVTVTTPRTTYADLFVPLMGEHQAINAAAAVAAAELSPTLAGRMTPEKVRDALAAVEWPGRMEFVPGCRGAVPGVSLARQACRGLTAGGLPASDGEDMPGAREKAVIPSERSGSSNLAVRPDMILDGAHNRASIEVLADALARHFPGRPMAILFAAAADKDVDGMMSALVARLPGSPVIFTRAPSPRAADPADLATRYARAGGKGALVAADLTAAIEAARRAAGEGGLVVACGSLYLVGELKRRIMNNGC